MGPFSRKSEKKEEVTRLDPQELAEPKDFNGFMRRGWRYPSRGDQDKAEVDFRYAVSYSHESVDANYAMGLSFKSQGRKEEATEAFKNTMELIEAGKVKEYSKSEMMRRLTLGHINELTKGNWNLGG